MNKYITLIVGGIVSVVGGVCGAVGIMNDAGVNEFLGIGGALGTTICTVLALFKGGKKEVKKEGDQ